MQTYIRQFFLLLVFSLAEELLFNAVGSRDKIVAMFPYVEPFLTIIGLALIFAFIIWATNTGWSYYTDRQEKQKDLCLYHINSVISNKCPIRISSNQNNEAELARQTIYADYDTSVEFLQKQGLFIYKWNDLAYLRKYVSTFGVKEAIKKQKEFDNLK